jgi:hypothetical protein
MDQPTIFATTESAKTTFKDDQPDRDRLSRTLGEMDVGLNSISFEHAFARFRLAEARAGGLNEALLRSIVDDVVTGTETLEGVAESFR